MLLKTNESLTQKLTICLRLVSLKGYAINVVVRVSAHSLPAPQRWSVPHLVIGGQPSALDACVGDLNSKSQTR